MNYTPVTPLIIQACLVGIAYFTAGYAFIYGPFITASNIGKFC